MSDLEAVIEFIKPDGPVELWGSTYGGLVAIVFAARHPTSVSRLILDGTYARGADLMSREAAYKFIDMLDLARYSPNVVFSSLSYMTDPDPRVGHESRVSRLKRAISPEILVDLYRLAHSADVSSFLADLTMPVLVLHRTHTKSVPFALGRQLGAELPDGHFVALEGRAHNLWEENPDAALQAIGSFLGIPGLRTAPSSGQGHEQRHHDLISVIFTDICGSTELTGRLGDSGAQQILHVHNEVVRSALERFAGREIKHTGDGLMASFRSATAAVTAALTIQRAVSEARQSGEAPELYIRIGINAGEPLAEDQDLFGAPVQIAARTCEAGKPNQILVTSVVRSLTQGKGFKLGFTGDHLLKGVEEPMELWEVLTD